MTRELSFRQFVMVTFTCAVTFVPGTRALIVASPNGAAVPGTNCALTVSVVSLREMSSNRPKD